MVVSGNAVEESTSNLVRLILMEDSDQVYVVYYGDSDKTDEGLKSVIASIASIKRSDSVLKTVEVDKEEWESIKDNQLEINSHFKHYFENFDE